MDTEALAIAAMLHEPPQDQEALAPVVSVEIAELATTKEATLYKLGVVRTGILADALIAEALRQE